MPRRIVLAVPEPQYAAKLARYWKENRPDWEVAAFTQELALLRHIRESGQAEALVVHASLLAQSREAAEAAGCRARLIALVERAGEGGGLPELAQYQPLQAMIAELEGLLGSPGGAPAEAAGPRIWTVFSAAGGAGKTTAALNLARQAGERGYRALYLNLEPLNATDLLFGGGDTDSLSRLLYALQSRPEQAPGEWERLRRRHSGLQAEYLDAPELPSERLAMPAERLRSLLDLACEAGGYDVIVVDPDSGCGDWHRELLARSGRVIWLATDDALGLRKAEKLLRWLQEEPPGPMEKIAFALNKTVGESANRWPLHGPAPAIRLPYVPQWKSMDQPGRVFQSPAFSGAIDLLLDALGLANEPPKADRRGDHHGRNRAVSRRTG